MIVPVSAGSNEKPVMGCLALRLAKNDTPGDMMCYLLICCQQAIATETTCEYPGTLQRLIL